MRRFTVSLEGYVCRTSGTPDPFARSSEVYQGRRMRCQTEALEVRDKRALFGRVVLHGFAFAEHFEEQGNGLGTGIVVTGKLVSRNVTRPPGPRL